MYFASLGQSDIKKAYTGCFWGHPRGGAYLHFLIPPKLNPMNPREIDSNPPNPSKLALSPAKLAQNLKFWRCLLILTF